MADWHVQCMAALRALAADSEFWDDHLGPLRTCDVTPFRVHLAIFVEPFLVHLGWTENG